MKKSLQCIFVMFFGVLMLSDYSFAQDKTLVGKVTTFDSIPLIGVQVTIKSTGQSVLTDSLGRFQVLCDPTDKVKFRADGFYPKEVKVQKEIRMILVNLNLKKGSDNFEKAERYVEVGYGSVSQKRLLNAVSSLNSKDLDFSRYSNMYELIQGRFAGVSVQGNTIQVRGVKTFYGVEGNSALLVVDGVIVSTQDFVNLSPLDVQSVDVLKDGSSSVYGSRGANGVIIVQTKKGN